MHLFSASLNMKNKKIDRKAIERVEELNIIPGEKISP